MVVSWAAADPPSASGVIPKPDGRQRPLAIAALEDKIVQRAATAVLRLADLDAIGSRAQRQPPQLDQAVEFGRAERRRVHGVAGPGPAVFGSSATGGKPLGSRPGLGIGVRKPALLLADFRIDQHHLGMAELIEALDAELAPNAGELAAAERNGIVVKQGTLTHTMPDWISFTARMLSARSMV